MVAQILLCHAGKEKWIHGLYVKYRDCFLIQEDISVKDKQRIDAMYK